MEQPEPDAEAPSRRPARGRALAWLPGWLRDAAADPHLLPQVLFVVMLLELAIYRLAVPPLTPPGDEAPPLWHAILTYVGLFLFYFASALAAAVLIQQLLRMVRERVLFVAPARLALAVSGFVFVIFAIHGIYAVASERDSFWLEASFVLTLLALIVAVATTRGDLWAQLGLLLVIAPLTVHFYGPFAIKVLYGDEALYNGLLERVQHFGLWLIVLAAIASPYLFSPRPFLEASAKLAPLALGAFVGLIGAAIMRQSQRVGIELAQNGLGIDLGAGAPPTQIALYLIALSALTWTLTSCLAADSPARRRIGVGLGLVVASGYAFAWPLQYLGSLVGLVTIGEALGQVRGEERAAARRRPLRFAAPPIAGETWQAYVAALVARLRGEPGGERTQAVTIAGDGGLARTHVVGALRDVSLKLTVDRIEGSVVGIDVILGREPLASAAPAWTLLARGEGLLAVAHPEPPGGAGPTRRTGDTAFDRRFRIRDRGGIGERLLDDGLRARVTGAVDGWLALWPERALRHRLHPGRGAPLDYPIPISELSFRGPEAAVAVDRLVGLLTLLAELAERVGLAGVSEPAALADELVVEPAAPAGGEPVAVPVDSEADD